MCFFRLFRRKAEKAPPPATKREVAFEEKPQTQPPAEEPVNTAPAAPPPVIKTEPQQKAVKAKEDGKKVQVIKATEDKIFVRIRYNRSFEARIIQSDDRLKNYYSEIKNHVLRYGVKPRISWKHETFKNGRELLVKLAVRGKTLNVYLALDPAAYAGTKYKIDDVSSVSKNASVPTLYKLKNDRRLKYCKELISSLFEGKGLQEGEEKTEDYSLKYPYEKIEDLIEKGLVKIARWQDKGDFEEGVIEVSKEQFEEIAASDGQYFESISVAEAEEKIADEETEVFVEESRRLSDRTKKDIVNVDALSKYFRAGEDVTIEEIRKRVPSVNKKATYIKVLARGRLDKALNIEADDFSPAAIKMIVLTGGTVKRTKQLKEV